LSSIEEVSRLGLFNVFILRYSYVADDEPARSVAGFLQRSSESDRVGVKYRDTTEEKFEREEME